MKLSNETNINIKIGLIVMILFSLLISGVNFLDDIYAQQRDEIEKIKKDSFMECLDLTENTEWCYDNVS